MDNLKNDIKNKTFKNIYLFFGDDYIKKYYVNQFKSAILGKLNSMDLTVLEGKTTIDTLISYADTMPFLGEYRLIIAKKTGLFNSGKQEEITKLENISTGSIIIFLEDNVDKRTKQFKFVSKIGTIAEFISPNENEILKWTKNYFSKKGKQISEENILYFIRSTPYDMNIISNEIDKLVSYSTNTVEILKEDIDLVVTKSIESKIFDMLKALGEKKLSQSIEIYNNMIYLKFEPLMILTMIARQFRLILHTKALVAQGYNSNEIAKELGVQSFTVKDYILQSKNFKYENLIEALEECLNTDINIKTGKISNTLAVEKLLIKFGM